MRVYKLFTPYLFRFGSFFWFSNILVLKTHTWQKKKKRLQAWPILFLTTCGFRKHQKFASNRKKKIRECIIGAIQP